MSWRDHARPVGASLSAKQSWRDVARPVTDFVEDLDVKQTQHPEIATSDRLLAKNFAQSIDKRKEFLEQKYPNLQFDFNAASKGQIKVKRPFDKEWQVVDPDNSLFDYSDGGVGELAKDVGDILYDVGSGVAEGAATTGAALASGPLAMPAAMGAGGASAAASETLRQYLGKVAGIPQDVDWGQVASTGAVGAVAPAAFGAGKTRGAIQIGGELVGKGLSAANPFPWLGEKISGVPRQIFRDYYDDAARETMKKLERDGVTDYIKNIYDNKIVNPFKEREEAALKQYLADIEAIGEPINIGPAKDAFDSAAKALDSRPFQTNADREKAARIKGIKNKFFGRYHKPEPEPEKSLLILPEELQPKPPPAKPKLVPNEVPAKRAFDIQKDLKSYADFNDPNVSLEDAATKIPTRDAYFKIRDAIDAAPGAQTSKSRQAVKDNYQFEREVLPYFQHGKGQNEIANLQKTFNTLSSLDRRGRKLLKERIENFSGVKPKEKKSLWQNIKAQFSPEELKKKADLEEGKKLLDLQDEARTLRLLKELGNPLASPISSGGTTSTSRTIPAAIAMGSLGSLGGYQMGGGYAGATVGGAAGATLGDALFSRESMRKMMDALIAAKRYREMVTPNVELRRRVLTPLAIEGATNPE